MRDDADLVRLSLEGDQSAYGLALSYVHSFADAEDVAQEAFISAYENLCSLRDPSRFGPWLKSAVVNLCRNWRRRRALLDRSSEEMKREIGEQVGVAPDRLCEAADLQARVLGAIARLSEKNGQAITLYYIDGLSTREIGDFLGVSTGAVDQRLHRGREQLKEEMIDMVEEVLRDSQPHAFPEKVLSEIAGRARTALEQQDRAAAVKHYDEALELLEPLKENREQKRWKADVLWERGKATYYLEPENRKEVIAELEAALGFERELGDSKRLARRLVGLGIDYANARRHPESLQSFVEAESIFEEMEETDEQAWALFWIGRHLIPWLDYADEIPAADYARSLDHFHRAADLFAAGKDRLGEAQAVAATDLLEALGEDPPADARGHFAAGALEMKRTSEMLGHESQPGFSESSGAAPNMTFAYMLKPPDWLRFPIETGRTWNGRVFAYGTEKMWATSSILRLDARVETPAGAFSDCLELETLLERRGEDPAESYRRLNLRNSGTRRVWFAPGVGLVKLAYRHGDDVETEAALTGHAAADRTDDYFPLITGVAWEYQVTSSASDRVVRDRCRVTSSEGEKACISQYHYAATPAGWLTPGPLEPPCRD